MLRFCSLLAAGLLVGGLIGCGSPVKEEEIKVQPPADPLVSARQMVERYAKGQPLSSEVTSFPHLVDSVRKVYPAKADVLEKGLADIQKAPPAARATKAKSLLKQL